MVETIFIFQFVVLLFSVVVHEVSHGYAALHLGDHTARLMGRLTLNPIKHIDLFGSILLPGMLLLTSALTGGFVPIFGWAKPVPYNPYNLKDPKRGGAFIAAMGPASNLFLALVFGLLYRFIGPMFGAAQPFVLVIVLINLVLALFNLIPIPPLDGSKILFGFLPRSTENLQIALERYGFFILLILLFTGLDFLSPFIGFLMKLLTGTNF